MNAEGDRPLADVPTPVLEAFVKLCDSLTRVTDALLDYSSEIAMEATYRTPDR